MAKELRILTEGDIISNPTLIPECPFSGHQAPNRQSSRDLIADIRKNGVEVLAESQPFVGKRITDYEVFKEHAYALSAIIIPEAIGLTLSRKEKRAPFGLLQAAFDRKNNSLHISGNPLQILPSDPTFASLEESMRYTLLSDLWGLKRELRNNQSSDGRRLYEIYRKLDEYGEAAGNNDAYGFVGKGINTATHVINNVLEVIPQVIKRDIPQYTGDVDTYLYVAQQNYSIIKELSRENISLFGKLTAHLRDNVVYQYSGHTPFNPRHFTLHPSGELKIADESFNDFYAANKDFFKEYVGVKSPTLGCPAIYSTAVRDLWEWHLQFAQMIWTKTEQQHVDTPFPVCYSQREHESIY